MMRCEDCNRPFVLGEFEAAAIRNQPKDSPKFPAARNGAAKSIISNSPINMRISELVKRQLKDDGLLERLSPHRFWVSAITNHLTQGLPLEDVH